MTKDRRSIQDRELARQIAQGEKQEQVKPIEDVACDCGCGVWPEAELTYYCDVDKYFKGKWCVNRRYKD